MLRCYLDELAYGFDLFADGIPGLRESVVN